jgi:NAD(P)-dependent dehydrogenase (short-subunit alcohol dehydrogenase family)
MSTARSSRVAVVTGATAGLGLELARALLAEGWAVVIDGRRPDLLETAVADLTPLGTVVGLAGDVTDPDHRTALVQAATVLGEVRLVVNNASTLGTSPLLPLVAVDPEVLTRTFATNVVAPLALVAELSPRLGDGAVIVDVSSDAAVEAYETWGPYGASKAALYHASLVLAAEHPTWRVLSVDPGDMRTQMHQDAFPGEDISDRPLPREAVPGLLALIDGAQPSGRYQARAVAVRAN